MFNSREIALNELFEEVRANGRTLIPNSKLVPGPAYIFLMEHIASFEIFLIETSSGILFSGSEDVIRSIWNEVVI